MAKSLVMTASNSMLKQIFLLLALLTTLGCAKDPHPERFPVSGAVKFSDGEPVRTGIVEFIPVDGSLTATGQIKTDGTYKLSTIENDVGAVPGDYIVVVKQLIFYDKIPEQKHDHGGDVDTVYADERTTPFKYKVNDGPNIADFQVIYAEK